MLATATPHLHAQDRSAGQTFVIVHGAWGGSWAFRETGRLLTAAGHTVYRPALTGLGEKVHLSNPDITLTTHITDVVNQILWENLRDVVLVGHSYGGMVITGVADRVPDRIARLIYLDAVVPGDGESLRDMLPLPAEWELRDGCIVPPWVNPKQSVPHDVPHPAKTLTEKIALRDQEKTKAIPTTYVLFVQPGTAIEKATFHPFYLRAKERGWALRTLASDHNPQFNRSDVLANLLDTCVKSTDERKEKQ